MAGVERWEVYRPKQAPSTIGKLGARLRSSHLTSSTPATQAGTRSRARFGLLPLAPTSHPTSITTCSRTRLPTASEGHRTGLQSQSFRVGFHGVDDELNVLVQFLA